MATLLIQLRLSTLLLASLKLVRQSLWDDLMLYIYLEFFNIGAIWDKSTQPTKAAEVVRKEKLAWIVGLASVCALNR